MKLVKQITLTFCENIFIGMCSETELPDLECEDDVALLNEDPCWLTLFIRRLKDIISILYPSYNFQVGKDFAGRHSPERKVVLKGK